MAKEKITASVNKAEVKAKKTAANKKTKSHFNFCSLFDDYYLPQAMVLINSLHEHCKDFTIYILALKDSTYDFLLAMKDKSVIPVRLSDVEAAYPKLLELKKERSFKEYCWTLSSYSILYPIETFKLDHCTYLDSDLCLYDDPSKLIDPKKSVTITRHNFYPKYDDSETCGYYCVQFMYFKNDKKGMNVLKWWNDRCTEWCYARFEAGLFGDQKYLDKWAVMFDCVHIPDVPGCGVGPWNVQRFDLEEKKDGHILVKDRILGTESNLIFYHFANVRYINEKKCFNGFYEIPQDAKKLIYAPYFKKLGVEKSKCPQPEPSLWKKMRMSPALINIKRWCELTGRSFKAFVKNFGPGTIKKNITDMYTDLK